MTATLAGFPDSVEQIDGDVVVNGRVRREGRVLQLEIELTRIADRTVLCSFACTGTREQALALHELLARRVLESLNVSVPESRSLVRRHSFDVAAYDLYLMSRHYWNTRTLDGLRRSIALAAQAVQRDPDYALAHAGLAVAYATLGTYTPEPLFDPLRSDSTFIRLVADIGL